MNSLLDIANQVARQAMWYSLTTLLLWTGYFALVIAFSIGIARHCERYKDDWAELRYKQEEE